MCACQAAGSLQLRSPPAAPGLPSMPAARRPIELGRRYRRGNAQLCPGPTRDAIRGRRRDTSTAQRLPPGQYQVTDFPVLAAGPTPRVDLVQWTFSIEGEIDKPQSWTWKEFLALPSEAVTKDIHCVTKWSKLA